MSDPASEAQVERFLAAVRDDDHASAERLLARFPEIASYGIHAASCACDATAVESFLARDPELATAPHGTDGWTPLVYLCQSRFHALDGPRAAASLRCARLLLDHGADPNTSTLLEPSDPNSRLSVLYRASVGNNVPVVGLLLERGAEPNDGESVYHAAERNHAECLDLLLAHGADISGRHSHWGNTPLYFLTGYKASHPGTPAATLGMRWLLEHGADPNVPSGEKDETPLHRVAGGGGGVAMAELLLAHGADVERARADGRTSWVLALRTGNEPVAQLLSTRGADSSGATAADALLGACMRADAALTRAIVEANPGLLDRLTAEDGAVVALAAEEGRSDAVRLMAELGFDLGCEGAWAGTPLHHAAWQGNVELVRLLLELGAPVDLRDREFGSSPIGWAAHGSSHCRRDDDQYCAVVELLLAAGADYAASINRWGEPPQAMARRRVRELLEARGFPPKD